MEKLLLYTEKDFQDITMQAWLSNKAPALQQLAITWFTEIKNCGKDVQDIFHDGCPMGCVKNAPFAYVNVFSTHANVGFFYGAFLPDENNLLEGNGKRMRHVKLKPGVTFDEKALLKLIRASYTDIKRRLEETGL